jgi:hypothetical protein
MTSFCITCVGNKDSALAEDTFTLCCFFFSVLADVVSRRVIFRRARGCSWAHCEGSVIRE